MIRLTSRGVMISFFYLSQNHCQKVFLIPDLVPDGTFTPFLLLCLQSIFESELKSHPETYYLYCFHTLWCFVYASGFLFMPLISYMYMPEQTLPMNFPEQDNFPMDIFFFCNRRPVFGGKVARWQYLIPSFPWIAPGRMAWGRNPRKGRDQILQRSVAEP